MGAGAVTTTTAAAFIPEIWSAEVIDSYLNNAVVVPLTDRSFQDLAKAGHGDIINVPNVDKSKFTMATITQGSDVGLWDQTTEGTTQITVQTWEGKRLSFPDVVSIQAMPALRRIYTEALGEQAAIKIDTAVLTLVASITQYVGTLNIDLDDSNIRRAIQYLLDANVPEGSISACVSPAQYMSWLDVDKYANSLYRGTTLKPEKGRGYIGPLYCFDLYNTTNVVSNTSGHDNVLFDKRWCATVIQQEPKIEEGRDINSLQDMVVCSILYGVKSMRDTSAVWLKGL